MSDSASPETPSEGSRLLIVGCGYVGKRVAALATAAGYEVFALTRGESRCSELRSAGCEPIVGSWHSPETLRGLHAVDKVLVAIPHREESELGEETHAVGLSQLRSAVEAQTSPGKVACRWIYLSTTGVFGECDGEVLNEDSPVSPTRIGPRIAVAAERWLAANLATDSTTIRLAGIYGPDRIPLAAKLRAGEPLSVPLSGYLNLVHVDDISQVVLHAFEHPLAGSTYLLSDGQPVMRREFYEELARLCGVSTPRFTEPAEGDAKSRRATSKRIDPSRIVAETGYHFSYPSYREGLPQSLGL
ncbi:MAG: SDR family oxidoreductase [Aureliella sp.]